MLEVIVGSTHSVRNILSITCGLILIPSIVFTTEHHICRCIIQLVRKSHLLLFAIGIGIEHGLNSSITVIITREGLASEDISS